MKCPVCDLHPVSFSNNVFVCPGGHEWAGEMFRAGTSPPTTRPAMTIKMRGQEFTFIPDENTGQSLMLVLALLAINNPDVDGVLKAFGLRLVLGGKQVFL